MCDCSAVLLVLLVRSTRMMTFSMGQWHQRRNSVKVAVEWLCRLRLTQVNVEYVLHVLIICEGNILKYDVHNFQNLILIDNMCFKDMCLLSLIQ